MDLGYGCHCNLNDRYLMVWCDADYPLRFIKQFPFNSPHLDLYPSLYAEYTDLNSLPRRNFPGPLIDSRHIELRTPK